MSNSVDNRIVNMQFNNAQFENGVKKSVKSLGDLKQGLNVGNSTAGLTKLQKVGNSFSLAGIEESANRVSQRLSAMSVIGITALVNLSNSAVNAGKQLISSLTVKPITDGLKEYETKMDAIQTIMTNTSNKGTTLDQVNEALQDLNTYSDLTIYNFAQMTDNIGKMTAAGLGLKESVTVVKGMSNVAAGFGVDATRMAGATYQMSQALSAGVIKLQDWKSLEQSGMGGQMLQDELLATARSMGKVVEAGVPFRETLQKGWLTTDVFVATMDKMANDKSLTAAAQNVTSFTKLLDTMKESVGSGWATTWENILGDKNQSTALFTGLNNAFSALIGPSTDARNAMLKFWNVNGGRDALIEALSTAFKSLMSILSPIHKAFRDVFPVDTGERLVAMTQGFRDLINKFKIGEEMSTNIGRTFKGLFAVLDVGVRVIKFVANAIGLVIGALMPGTGGLLGGLLAGTAGFGDFLVSIRNVIVDSKIFVTALEKIGKVMDYVENTISVATSVLTTMFSKLKEIMSPYIDNIKEAINKSTLFTDSISNLKQMFDNFSSSGPDTFSNKLSGALGLLSKKGSEVKDSFSWVGPVLDKIMPKLEEVGKILKDKLSPVIEFIGSKLKELTIGDVGTLLAGGGLLILAKTIKKLISSVKGSLEPIKDITQSFKDVLGGVTGSLEAFQTKLKADALFKIATAIGLLAVSIVMLSMVEPDKLKKALYALSLVVGELALSMMILQKSSLGTEGLTGRLIALGLSVLLLVNAVKKLGELDQTALNQGVVGIAAILTTLALFTKFTSGAGIQSSMSSMVGLSIAILILVKAVEKFGELDQEVLDQGIQGISSMLVALALFIKLVGKPEGLVGIGFGLTVIGTSMLIFATAVGKFGELSPGDLTKGLIGLAGSLAAVTKMVRFLPDAKSLAGVGVGLTIMAGALYIIAGAVAIFGSMSLPTLATGIGALGGSLLIISLAAKSLKGSVAGAAAMMIMAVAINMLIPAIALLGALPLKVLGSGLLGLAGIFLVIGISALVLTPIIPIILLFSTSILILGTGLYLLGGGLVTLSVGLAALVLSGVPFTAFLVGLINLIPMIATKLVEGLVAMGQAIIIALPTLLEALKGMAEGMILVLTEITPQVVEALLTFIVTMLVKLSEAIPLMIQAAADIILGILKGISDNIQKIVEAAIDVCNSFINGITAKLPEIIDTAYKFIIGFIDGLAQAVENNHDALQNAIIRLMTAIIDSIMDFIPKLGEVGKNIIKGIMKGFESMGSALVDAAKGVVGDAVNGVKNFLGIHSPSRLFAEIGKYSALGMAVGLEEYSGKVSNAATDVGSDAVDSLKNAIGNISDVVNSNVDMNPTIRPVMDLTDVTAGAGEINSLFNQPQGISTSVSSTKASSINSNMQRTKENQNGVIQSDSINNLKNQPTNKTPMTLQLVLQNGKAIAEYIVDDIDGLIGNKTQIEGRMVGV